MKVQMRLLDTSYAQVTERNQVTRTLRIDDECFIEDELNVTLFYLLLDLSKQVSSL